MLKEHFYAFPVFQLTGKQRTGILFPFQDDHMFEGIFQLMHLIFILLIVLIVFGPGKLPELGEGTREEY